MRWECPNAFEILRWLAVAIMRISQCIRDPEVVSNRYGNVPMPLRAKSTMVDAEEEVKSIPYPHPHSRIPQRITCNRFEHALSVGITSASGHGHGLGLSVCRSASSYSSSAPARIGIFPSRAELYICLHPQRWLLHSDIPIVLAGSYIPPSCGKLDAFASALGHSHSNHD
jgi:hypothetical protein